MKAAQDTINNFFSLTRTQFNIPSYQRNYKWKKENCAKILEDLVAIARDSEKKHFMGSITYIIHLRQENGSLRNTQEYEIIDGQQRITTCMLLLKALQVKSKDERTNKDIALMLGIDDEMRLRLKPIKRDKEAFECIMEGRHNDYSGASQVKDNYIFFLKELDKHMKEGYTIEEIYNAFFRLVIVGIGLEIGDDDPQVVFESINATGVRLEGIDLIRNFLMMGNDHERQTQLYETYWVKLEEYLQKDTNVKDFMIDYLRIYYGAGFKKDDEEMYLTFKRHSKEHFNDDIEGLMRDLREYARIYQIFIDYEKYDGLRIDYDGNEYYKKSAILKEKIQNIVDLKFGVSYPFLMSIFNDFEQGILDFDNLNGMLEIIISYYVRRMICGEASNALNKLAYELYKNLKNKLGVNAEGLARFLGQKEGREIFPDDRRVKEKFYECDAYSLRATRLILLEIEKSINAEPPKEEGLQVEHFYPQTPTKKWREFVREGEYEELENVYLHTFGNLSLTGQNLKLGNKPFEEKIELLLENGSLKLNEYFTNMDTWGIKEIRERSEYLANKFCEIEIFKDLPKEYRKRHTERNLSDDLTYYYFNRLFLPDGQGCDVKTLKELAQTIVDYLYQYHREAVEEATDENLNYIEFDEKRAKFRDKDGTLVIKCEKGSFWFISSASARDTGKNLAHLIKSCRLDPQEFILEN